MACRMMTLLKYYQRQSSTASSGTTNALGTVDKAGMLKFNRLTCHPPENSPTSLDKTHKDLYKYRANVSFQFQAHNITHHIQQLNNNTKETITEEDKDPTETSTLVVQGTAFGTSSCQYWKKNTYFDKQNIFTNGTLKALEETLITGDLHQGDTNCTAMGQYRKSIQEQRT
eukprot:9214249-Ditylum_brightwellii.AAC.1